MSSGSCPGNAAGAVTDVVGLCREFLSATRALLVAATNGDDVLVVQMLHERAGLLAALDAAGLLSPTERSECLALLGRAQELEQDVRQQLEHARARALAALRALHDGRHALHAYRAAAGPGAASLCLDQNG